MKNIINKYLLVLIVNILLVTLSLGFYLFEVRADSEKDQIYKEYTLSFETYKNDLDDFILARSKHKKFNTLTSKIDLRNETYPLLGSRDRVMENYLNLLYFETLNRVSGTQKNELLARILLEIEWFQNHRKNLKPSQTLEELNALSLGAAQRHDTLGRVSLEISSEIAFSTIESLQTRMQENFTEISEVIDAIKNDPRKEYQFSNGKIQLIDRWLFETNKRILRSAQQTKDARDYYESLKDTNKKNKKLTLNSKTYGALLSRLQGAGNELTNSSLFLMEIIREIKTKE